MAFYFISNYIHKSLQTTTDVSCNIFNGMDFYIKDYQWYCKLHVIHVYCPLDLMKGGNQDFFMYLKLD